MLFFVVQVSYSCWLSLLRWTKRMNDRIYRWIRWLVKIFAAYRLKRVSSIRIEIEIYYQFTWQWQKMKNEQRTKKLTFFSLSLVSITHCLMSRNFRSGITSKLCKMYDQAVSAIDIVTRPYSRIVNTQIVKCKEEKKKAPYTKPNHKMTQFNLMKTAEKRWNTWHLTLILGQHRRRCRQQQQQSSSFLCHIAQSYEQWHSERKKKQRH